jgi:nitrilase
MRFPQVWQRLAVEQHIDVVLHPVAFARDSTFYSWRPTIISRALETQVFVLSVNRAGADWGRSILCPPWVEVDAPEQCLGDKEELRVIEIDRAALCAARKAHPYHKGRRDDYAELHVTSVVDAR